MEIRREDKTGNERMGERSKGIWNDIRNVKGEIKAKKGREMVHRGNYK